MRDILSIDRSFLDYFTVAGLRTTVGASEFWWDEVILIELLANAADAIDELDDKHIYVSYEDDILGVYDNGNGFSEQILYGVYDFSAYSSSKRTYKSLSRGIQGNALKCIIGICHVNGYKLSFACRESGSITSKKLTKSYPPGFDTKKEAADVDRSGVIIRGIGISARTVMDCIHGYRLSNPDITFHFNDEIYKAVATPVSRTKKTLIEWYTFEDFKLLASAINDKSPDRSVMDFLTKSFSGIRGNGGLDKRQFGYQKLSDYAEEQKMRTLYESVKDQMTSEERDDNKLRHMFSKFLIGKKNIGKIHDDAVQFTYERAIGEYEYDGARIPYAFEGCLMRNPYQGTPLRMVSALNNALTYADCPFEFDWDTIDFCKDKYDDVYSVKSLLDKSGFTRGKGLTLFLHLLTPSPIITDKAKTEILVTPFRDEVTGVIESVCCKTLRAIRRNNNGAADKVQTSDRKLSKEFLMEHYFLEGFEHASGGSIQNSKSKTTVRQIFYVVRQLINARHGITLNPNSDYNRFTQKVATRILENHPELTGRVLFERRGFFYDSFNDSEVPLGTADVLEFITWIPQNKIYTTQNIHFSIPRNRQYNKILFVEKQGFNIILKESGLLDRLHMSVMSTQGFSNRASKILMKYFIDRKIKVYALHDCDVAGQLIFEKIHKGSETFKEPLPDVKQIGLTLEDVDELGKRDYAEEHDSEINYAETLSNMEVHEREFFDTGRSRVNSVGKKIYVYRRVELNTLTAPELIEFVGRKIPREPIDLPADEIAGYINIDEKEIIKEALYQVFGTALKLNIDTLKIGENVRNEVITSQEHWVHVLQDHLLKVHEEKVEHLARMLREQGFGELDLPEID